MDKMDKVVIAKSSIVFTVLFIVSLILGYYSRYILIASLVGVGLGVLIMPILNFLRSKFRLPRAVSALVVFICIMIITSVVLGSLYYIVADQVSSLSERAPKIIESINLWVSSKIDKYPWLKQEAQDYDFANSLKTSAYSLFKGFQTGVVAISGAVFALVIGLYTAVDGNSLFNSTIEAFKPKHRNKARSVFKACAIVFRGWFKAQLIDMLIIGSLTALGLWIAGVEYWAVFGLLTAVLGIIPYVGIILVVAAASLITLASDPSKVPWVIGIFMITQQLEGNVILPLVMKGKAELPVVPLLIFMLILGNFLGILGVFIAPALLAILRTLYIELYLPKINDSKINNPRSQST